MQKYAIGLDLGIKNIGWSIYDLDNSSIVNYGVRIFNESSSASDRRSFRAGRRLRKRKKNRIKDVKNILDSINFPSNNTLDTKMIYTRCRGIKEQITKQDITNILFYFCTNRGYIPFDENDDPKTKLEFITLNGRFPCEYYKEMLDDINKYHNMNKLVLNKDNLREIKQLLSIQKKFYPELTDNVITNIINIISRKRTFWEGPGGGKNLVITPYGRFKSQKDVENYIQNKEKNPYYEEYLFEDLIGNCEIAINDKKAPILNYYSEKFNAINLLINLYFVSDSLLNDNFKKEKDYYKLNRKGIETILNYALENNEMALKKLIEKGLKIDFDIVKGYSDEELKIFEHYIYIKKQFIKLNHDISWMENIELYNKIVYYLTFTPGILEFTNFVNNNLSDEYDFDDSFFEIFKEIRRKRISYLKYHRLSEKILIRAIDDILKCEKNFSKIRRELKYDEEALLYFKKNYTNQTRKLVLLEPKHIDNIIASPQVKKTLRQAIKIINAIIKEEKCYPQVIAIESTKEVNTELQQKIITKSQKIQKELHDAAIKELGDIKNYKLIEKYMLFKEVNGVCPYCGTPLTKDFTSWDNIHIDHILPRSITFDDSFENRTACCHDCNEHKKNCSPYEYLKGKNLYDEFKKRINTLKISDEKKENFLNENILDKYKIRFFNRNLSDTAYATTELIKQINLLNNYNDNKNIIKTFSTSGKITSEIRKKYDLGKDRNTLFHHAVDASILTSMINTEYGKLVLESQNDKKFWVNNGFTKINKINEIIDNIDISKNINEIRTIDDNNIRKSMQVDKIVQGTYANANLYKIIKKEENYYKIEQVDIYNDLLFADKNSIGIDKFESLFDENDKKMVLLCQEKDYKLFKKLKDIYYQYKGINGNPFINYLIEIGEYDKSGVAGVHYGIRQNNKNSAFVKTLRYYTPITDPYLIDKKNINKKDKTLIGYNGLTQICTQIFYDEEKKKYVFLPINKICVKSGKIDENNEYYRMIYNKLIGDKKLKFIDNIYCGDCVDVIKKDGTVISDYYSSYHKTNNILVLKSGQYFTQYDQDIIIYDVDVLGNKKRRVRD